MTNLRLTYKGPKPGQDPRLAFRYFLRQFLSQTSELVRESTRRQYFETYREEKIRKQHECKVKARRMDKKDNAWQKSREQSSI